MTAYKCDIINTIELINLILLVPILYPTDNILNGLVHTKNVPNSPSYQPELPESIRLKGKLRKL